MLIKYTPKVEHLKCVVLTPAEGIVLTRTMVQLLPGTNEVTDDEWKSMKVNLSEEFKRGEITILAQKVGDGRGKPGGRKAKDLADMPVNLAVRYVMECNNPETLTKWYKEITKEEVRLAIAKRMKALNVEAPEDEIPETPNASPMSLDEYEADDENENDDETVEDEATEDSDNDFEDFTGDETSEEKDFSSMKIKELKKECEERGIDYSNFTKKEDYISALTEDNPEEE